MKLNKAIAVIGILIVLIYNCYAVENKKNKIVKLKQELCFVADFNTSKSGNILKNVRSVKCPVSNK